MSAAPGAGDGPGAGGTPGGGDARPRRGARGLTRRRLLLGGAAAVAGLAALRVGLPWWWRPGPRAPLDPEAEAFARRLFAEVDPRLRWDVHAHAVGLGAGGSGCSVHPDYLDPWHPWKRLQFDLYRQAARLEAGADDGTYVDELLRLHRQARPGGRLVLLAFDRFVDEDGRERPERSNFHTPDAYVLALARRHADVVAGVSIHPYRLDAIERLDRAAEAGARLVKWLPNAMGIDPASPRCDAFYRRLAALGLPLLSHAGTEMAVDAADLQALGNPLRLRRALEHGVTVIVAHCGSLGDGEDLDAPAGARRRRPNLELFLRLMREGAWEGRLFGEISALTFVNRAGGPLREVLAATDLHPRLVNGSDYPLVAVDPVLSTWWLQQRGLLDPEERRLCNLVGRANPLLLDDVVKACVSVAAGGGRARFPPSVFETGRIFA